jgi:signal peptidase I
MDVRLLLSRLTESLANLSMNWVLIGIGGLLVALAFLRLVTRGPRSNAAWLSENIQVILSVIVVVFLIIRPFLFQAFYIPSNSMVPTLMGPPDADGFTPGTGSGDRLLVNKLIYKVGNPSRFDIVVFHAPVSVAPDGKEYIKRTIGLPGETIEVVGPRLLVDGKPAINIAGDSGYSSISLDETNPQVIVQGNVASLRSSGEPYKIMVSPTADVQYDPYRVTVDGKVALEDPEGRIETSTGLDSYGGMPGVYGSVYLLRGVPRLAVLRGTKLEFVDGHLTVNGKRLIEPYIKEPPNYTMAPRLLEKNQYFMMGDNRNNSNDSHMWGPLERDRVIGRAEILFWPLNRFRIFHVWLLSLLIGIFVAYQGALRLTTR